MSRGQLYYLPNARTPKQRAEMVALEAAGICIFCPEAYSYGERRVLVEHEYGEAWSKEVLLENDGWSVLLNEYPYEGALQHYLLVPKDHVIRMTDLALADRAGYFDLLEQAVEKFNLEEYYVLGIRNGNPAYTGATICHLHVQLVAVDPAHRGEPIRLFMSSSPPPVS